MNEPRLKTYLSAFEESPLAAWAASLPWDLTAQSESVVRALLDRLPEESFEITGNVAVHRTASVETGAVLKGPLVVGAWSFVAAGAYLRGGCWLGTGCTIGPGCELKSSFVFDATTLAHFNFVGDTILGKGVNIEAGAVICNFRNERPQAGIRVRIGGVLRDIPALKFGALVGDGARLGANSVLAPGALLRPGTVVQRAALHDQEMG
ncbi:MAG: LpxA family transferase [Pseudorhodoferax sp.]